MVDRFRVLLANFAGVLSGKAIAAVVGLGTMMLLTRHLGPRDFGYYRTVFTYAAFAAVLADMGLYMTTLKEMSVPGADTRRVVGTALSLRLMSSIVVILPGCVLAWAFPYDPVVKWGVLIGAAIFTCIQASDFMIAVFQRELKQGRNALAEVSGAVATFAAVWLLVWVNGRTLSMLVASLLGTALALTISWRLAKRLVPFTMTIDLRSWKRYLAWGLPIAGSQVLTLCVLRGDSLVLSFYHPASDVGLYGVSTKLLELATSLSFMFGGLMMPSLTCAAARGREEFPRVLGHALDTAIIYGVGAVLALAPFAPDVLTLIAGPQFAQGAPALMVISGAVGLTALSQVLRFSLVACERNRWVLQADAAACLAGFGTYFALIPRFSIVGAAIGLVVAQASSVLGMLWGLKRAGVKLPGAANALKALIAGAVAMACMEVSDQLDWPWMLSIAMGGVIYLLGLTLAGAIPVELMSLRGLKPR